MEMIKSAAILALLNSTFPSKAASTYNEHKKLISTTRSKDSSYICFIGMQNIEDFMRLYYTLNKRTSSKISLTIMPTNFL